MKKLLILLACLGISTSAFAYSDADLEKVQAGGNCVNGDLSGADLSGLDLSGRNFEGTKFNQARLIGERGCISPYQ